MLGACPHGSTFLQAKHTSLGGHIVRRRSSSHTVRLGSRLIRCAYQSNEKFGNTTSGSNRAALQEKINAPIDISREAVSTQSVPPTGARKSFRVSLFDAMKFNGPAPERINGRLAMLGFLFGSINEAKTAVPILEQAKINPIFVGGIVVLFTWASLIPITKGARSEAFALAWGSASLTLSYWTSEAELSEVIASAGAFSPKAEVTNGRAAMLGIAILLVLEQNAGASFF